MEKKTIARAVSKHVQKRNQHLPGTACVAVLAIQAYGSIALAQESNNVETAKLLDLEEIVVTGTPGSGVRKLDASFAITSMDADTISRIAPKSTADLFKSVPGIWSESSGGSSGANIQVRGLPAPGDAPFVTVAINGSPVYGTPSLSFFEHSTLFRMDETIERMEALRGGPNPVLASGQPGLTTNFQLKQGTEQTEGLIKYSTSDYDLNRLDAVLSGKLTQDLYYMAGGYVSRSPGVRDAQFNSEKGQQFTINITKELENGTLTLYSRATDDTGAFYSAIPLGNSLKDFPGFDAGTGTYVGNDMRFVDIAVNANGDVKSYDLADGRGVDAVINGLSFEAQLSNGWTVRDNMNLMSGDANTIGLFNTNTQTAAQWAGAAGFGSASEVTSARSVAANEAIVQVGFWVVEKTLESFTNDMNFSKNFLNDSNTLSVGMYIADYSASDFWSLNNNHFVTATTNSKRVDIVDGTGKALSVNGRSSGAGTSLRQKANAQTRAFYIVDSWDITDTITLETGARHESVDIEFSIDNNDGSVILPDGLTLSNVPDGTIERTESIEASDTSYTAGVNWAITDSMGVFLRANQGHLFPTFETVRGHTNFAAPVTDINQYEVGYKLSTDYFGVFATAFLNQYQGSQQRVIGNSVIVDQTESESTGLEIDAVWDSGNGLSINLSATLLDGEYTKYQSNPDNIGNQVQRAPQWQMRMSPSYEFSVGDANTIVLYGTFSAVGDRYSDPENAQPIDGYEKVDLGAQWYAGERLHFQLFIDNLTNEIGLTEANARVLGAQQGIPQGRAIMGRSTRLSVGYTF